MANPFRYRDYQLVATEHLLQNPRAALWAGCGMGKTATVLAALRGLTLTDDPYPALVIAPKRVARDVWATEAAKWDEFADTKVVAITGSVAERIVALKQKADIYAINYENLPWLVERFGKQWPFKTIIADEATRLKGFRLRQGGERTRALAKVAWLPQTSRFWELTGTPSSNGLPDLWGQLYFLDKGQRLGRSFFAFTDRWFRAERVSDDPHAVRHIPMPSAEMQIHAAIQDICLSLRPEDWFALQTPHVTQLYCDLPAAAMRQYKSMERQLFTELARGEIEAVNAADKSGKCLQLANGAIYTEEGRHEIIHDSKLDLLDSLVEECGGAPLLVAYHWRHDLIRLLKRFPGGCDLSTDKGMKQFLSGEYPVGFGHPASIGHGVDGLQQVCWQVAFFSHYWSFEHRQQFIDRVGPVRQMQAGHNRVVQVWDLVARGTLDELVLLRQDSKQTVHQALMAAARGKG